jgi:hypothetical protein
MPRANYYMFLRATGSSALADSTSAEYQYSVCGCCNDDISNSDELSSGVVVVNELVIGKGVQGSSRELTYGIIQCVSGATE